MFLPGPEEGEKERGREVMVVGSGRRKSSLRRGGGGAGEGSNGGGIWSKKIIIGARLEPENIGHRRTGRRLKQGFDFGEHFTEC